MVSLPNAFSLVSRACADLPSLLFGACVCPLALLDPEFKHQAQRVIERTRLNLRRNMSNKMYGSKTLTHDGSGVPIELIVKK